MALIRALLGCARPITLGTRAKGLAARLCDQLCLPVAYGAQMLTEEAEEAGREVPPPPAEARRWCAILRSALCPLAAAGLLASCIRPNYLCCAAQG